MKYNTAYFCHINLTVMTNTFEQLGAGLENRLNDVKEEGLAGLYEKIELVKRAISDHKGFLREHGFTSKEEEIYYFKVIAPPLYGQLFLHLKKYEARMEKNYSGPERFKAYLNLEQTKLFEFYQRHQEFYYYFSSGEPLLDDRVFVRDKKENTMKDPVEAVMGDDFCVGCYWAAQLWANERLRDYFLQESVEDLRLELMATSAEGSVKLTWTDSTTDLVEVLYGFHEKKCFNNGKVSLKNIAEWVESHWGIELGNYHNTWAAIASRKKSKTKYHDEARELLLKKIDAMD